MPTRGEREVAIAIVAARSPEPAAVILAPESITSPELLLEYQDMAEYYGQEVCVQELYRVTEADQVIQIIRSLNDAEPDHKDLQEQYWATVTPGTGGYASAIKELLRQLPTHLLQELVESKEEPEESEEGLEWHRDETQSGVDPEETPDVELQTLRDRVDLYHEYWKQLDTGLRSRTQAIDELLKELSTPRLQELVESKEEPNEPAG